MKAFAQFFLLTSFVTICIASCSTIAEQDRPILSYDKCFDVVIVGKFTVTGRSDQNAYGILEQGDDFEPLFYFVSISVKRVIYGGDIPRTLTSMASSDAALSRDRNFVFVARKARQDDHYNIYDLALSKQRPIVQPKEECE